MFSAKQVMMIKKIYSEKFKKIMTKYLTLVKTDYDRHQSVNAAIVNSVITKRLLLCPHYFVFYSSSSTKLLYAKENAIKMFSDKISLNLLSSIFLIS